MRLTLRTLLSWLDDTLPAPEVRAIGQQVNESVYARELVDRIRKVTRQRRLSVPPSNGPESTDPNLVADYLDNTLPAEKVAEYERVCLKSDVHLAEVASAHQVLSLLGQKAKVPPDARYRMYHLVKGREALGERARRSAAPVKPEPVAAEVPTWRPEPAARRDAASRLVPLVAGAALVLLAWSTWDNLRPRRVSEDLAVVPPAAPRTARPQPVPEAPAQAAAPAPELAKAAPPAPVRPAAEAPPPATDNAAADVDVAVNDEMPAPAVPAAAAATGAIVEPEPGLLLTRAEDTGPWKRLLAGAAVRPGEVILGLDPFRSALRLDALELRVLDATQFHFLESAADGLPVLALDEGRLVVRSQEAASGLVLALGDARLSLELPADVPIGLERPRVWRPGQAKPSEPGLILSLPEGDLGLVEGGRASTLSGPLRLAFSPSGELRERVAEPAPAWVVDLGTPIDREEAGRQLLRFFKADKPPVTSFVEALASNSEELRGLAFQALGALGQFPLLIDALHTPSRPETRRAAIGALRQALARGEATSTRLVDDLRRSNRDESWGPLAESLLRGYAADDLADEATRTRLLAALEHPDVAIRELCLDNLMRLTSRGDSMGYDPDEPSQRGLKAWRDLLQPRVRGR
jgi:hypothetical protein